MLTDCRHALKRMREGITLLTSDPQAVAAFSFMNEAMWQQHVHSLLSELSDFAPQHHSWRPFQLAFILLNLSPPQQLRPARRQPHREAADRD